ncbi:hypothetical protein MTO98_23830 [Mucilaginibacter sp. SMC90]|uniref:hypothetical protein n=1 Tax=Mucilaginibacter sp. SMC90 TaxID=2929803 RepID=UPI001FB48DE2|nr:hypothetical protein [Mucilaginibacter sp. SMC90]UOE47441.1 hypothetical protein MTO98_23830 [Mucilaginibacter sp. SMC90]
MWMLWGLLIIAAGSIINCFQFAAAILAKQIGLSFWKWFGISTFLPIISIFILLYLWKDNGKENPEKQVAH